jgi:hypothetical protein
MAWGNEIGKGGVTRWARRGYVTIGAGCNCAHATTSKEGEDVTVHTVD